MQRDINNNNNDDKYTRFRDEALPGVSVEVDWLDSFAVSLNPTAESDAENEKSAPKLVTFSAEFYLKVYNYFAEKLDQPLLSQQEISKVNTSDKFKSEINNLVRQAKESTKPVIDNNLMNNNLIIGEVSHTMVAPKKLLIEQMKNLKANGYDTLYLEHIYYDEHQTELDKLHKNHPFNKNSELGNQLTKLDRGHPNFLLHKSFMSGKENFIDYSKQYSDDWKKYNFTNVVLAAQEARIRVVAIDFMPTYESQSANTINNDYNARIAIGDYSFAKIIEHDQLEHKGKWVAMIGAAHIPGLELLTPNEKTVSLLVGDNTRNQLLCDCRGNMPVYECPDPSYNINKLPRADIMLTTNLDGKIPLLSEVKLGTGQRHDQYKHDNPKSAESAPTASSVKPPAADTKPTFNGDNARTSSTKKSGLFSPSNQSNFIKPKMLIALSNEQNKKLFELMRYIQTSRIHGITEIVVDKHGVHIHANNDAAKSAIKSALIQEDQTGNVADNNKGYSFTIKNIEAYNAPEIPLVSRPHK